MAILDRPNLRRLVALPAPDAGGPFRRRPLVVRRRDRRAGGWVTRSAKCEKSCFMPIAIFDSDTVPRDRRAELEAAVVTAGRHPSELFEGWIVATPDRGRFAVDHV
ncbi:MAG: hypothetical protein ABSF54_18620 [Bryobacteraceae bacterium]